MMQTLSLADLFPTALDQLIRTGRALFETTLDHFDRRYPGFYLQKVEEDNVYRYFPKEKFSTNEFRRMVYLTRIRQEQDSRGSSGKEWGTEAENVGDEVRDREQLSVLNSQLSIPDSQFAGGDIPSASCRPSARMRTSSS